MIITLTYYLLAFMIAKQESNANINWFMMLTILVEIRIKWSFDKVECFILERTNVSFNQLLLWEAKAFGFQCNIIRGCPEFMSKGL